MQIKPAPNANESDVLKAAMRSNRVLLLVGVIGASAWLCWRRIPDEHKRTYETLAFGAVSAGLYAIKTYNDVIKKGRLDIGDLAPEIASRALLSLTEAQRLEQVMGFVEGKASLSELPAVRKAIAAEIPPMNVPQRFSDLAAISMGGKTDADPSSFAQQWKPRVDVSRYITPRVEVPNYEAPV